MKGLAVLLIAALLGVAGCDGSSPEQIACARTPVTTESGLTYEDLRCGTGAEATGGSSVTIRYTAALEDGTQFDSSMERGGSFVFPLGRGQVIQGLEEGVRGMRAGGARRLELPPHLAYGDAGFPPDVPPDATVVFRVGLLEVSE
jgi:FKBP-type peptidyl-prolyl cis-trans isomerase